MFVASGRARGGRENGEDWAATQRRAGREEEGKLGRGTGFLFRPPGFVAAEGENGIGCSAEGLGRTYRVVFQHAHGRRRPRAGELVEEARQGHGEEAHRDDAGFRCW